MRVVVDIGSNSVKFSASKSQGGAPEIIASGSWVTRLGAGAKERRLLPESIAKTEEALREMRAQFDALGKVEIVAVATSAVRDSVNPEEISARVQAILGVPLRVLSGDEEARFSIAGALTAARSGWGTERVLFIDVGGASTEVGMAVPQFRGHSFRAGAVRCHEPLALDVMPVSDASWTQAQLRMADFFAPAEWEPLRAQLAPLPTQAVAIGGTLVLAAKLLRAQGRVRVAEVEGGFRVSRADFESLNDELRRKSLEERLHLPYMVPGRADIVCAGILCLTHVLKLAGCQEVLVTEWGLRHGILRCWDEFH